MSQTGTEILDIALIAFLGSVLLLWTEEDFNLPSEATLTHFQAATIQIC